MNSIDLDKKVKLDRVVGIHKVGDQEPQLGAKDGDLLCYISEREWGLPIEKIISDETMRIFCCVEYSEKMLSKIKDFLVEELVPTEGGQAYKIDFDKLASIVKDETFVKRLRSKTDVVQIAKSNKIDENIFID